MHKTKKDKTKKTTEDDDDKLIEEHVEGSDTETEEGEVTDEDEADENAVSVSLERLHKTNGEIRSLTCVFFVHVSPISAAVGPSEKNTASKAREKS